MKKLLTIAALAGVASLAYGQGYVQFQNTSQTRVTTNAVALGGGTGFTSVAIGGEYYYALLVAPSTTTTIGTSLAGWTFTGDIATNSSAVGRLIDAGTVDGTSVQVPNYAAGTTASFAVVGFSANVIGNPALTTFVNGDGSANATAFWTDVVNFWNGGSTLTGTDTAIIGSTGFFGISAVATGVPVNAVGQGAVLFSTAAGSVNGFVLTDYQVPEPATFALCGLGAAALVIFRRRS